MKTTFSLANYLQLSIGYEKAQMHGSVNIGIHGLGDILHEKQFAYDPCSIVIKLDFSAGNSQLLLENAVTEQLSQLLELFQKSIVKISGNAALFPIYVNIELWKDSQILSNIMYDMTQRQNLHLNYSSLPRALRNWIRESITPVQADHALTSDDVANFFTFLSLLSNDSINTKIINKISCILSPVVDAINWEAQILTPFHRYSSVATIFRPNEFLLNWKQILEMWIFPGVNIIVRIEYPKNNFTQYLKDARLEANRYRAINKNTIYHPCQMYQSLEETDTTILHSSSLTANYSFKLNFYTLNSVIADEDIFVVVTATFSGFFGTPAQPPLELKQQEHLIKSKDPENAIFQLAIMKKRIQYNFIMTHLMSRVDNLLQKTTEKALPMTNEQFDNLMNSLDEFIGNLPT